MTGIFPQFSDDLLVVVAFNSVSLPPPRSGVRGWRRGVAVERRIRDREVAGSSLGRALRRKNSGQVSHTYG